MYKLLKINNFRQFNDTDIYLGKILTVLAGGNSTGKSTILGLLANSGELKKKDGVTLSNRQFRAEFSEILHGSKKYDVSGSNRLQIDIVDNSGNLIDTRKFRTAWQKGKDRERFRIIPLGSTTDGKKTESKFQIPILYLGLSRLFPIGEAEEDGITARSVKFDSKEYRDWFVEQYNRILSLNDSIKNVEIYKIGETLKKTGIGIETDKYDYLTNSSGQDNLGQILMALLSLKQLKKNRPQWNGGLLLIDEVDATLHPAAQKKLMDLIIKEAKENNYQIVFTTHSTDLLEHVSIKTKNNTHECNNIELYYFTNANRKLEVKRNPSFSSIKNDLLITSMVQNVNKVKVYTEDSENRWFLKNLVPEYLPYIELLDVNIGCVQLISLYMGDLTYFGNTIIVFDGDVSDDVLGKIPQTVREKLNNILLLPGEKRPEEVIYNYIISLPPEHSYWMEAQKVDMSWRYFNENGPMSNRYSQGKEREKYKAWFLEHQKVFDNTGLFNYWKEDNRHVVKLFRENFKTSYNCVANRIFATPIP